MQKYKDYIADNLLENVDCSDYYEIIKECIARTGLSEEQVISVLDTYLTIVRSKLLKSKGWYINNVCKIHYKQTKKGFYKVMLRLSPRMKEIFRARAKRQVERNVSSNDCS